MLRIDLRRCINETQSIPCASNREIEDKIGKMNLQISSLINFVEYEEVEPGVGPIKRISKTIKIDKLNQDFAIAKAAVYSFIEHKVSLEDNLFQIMTDSVEFDLLNLDLAAGTTVDQPIETMRKDDQSIFQFYLFDLSQTIKVEKRQVTSLPELFGELGGLYEFFATLSVTLIGAYQAKMLTLDQIKSLFRVSYGS